MEFTGASLPEATFAASRGAVSTPVGSGTLSCGGAPGAAGRLSGEISGCGPIGRVPGETMPPAVLPLAFAPLELAPVAECALLVPAPNVGGEEAPTVVLVRVPTGATGPWPAAAALAVGDAVGSRTGDETPAGSFVLTRFGLWVDGVVEEFVDVAGELLVVPPAESPGVAEPAVCAWEKVRTEAAQRPARIKAYFEFIGWVGWVVRVHRRTSAAFHGASLPVRTDRAKRHLFRRGNLPQWQAVHA